MKFSIVLLLAAVLAAPGVSADDIGLISIKSHTEASTVTSIIGYAHGRVGLRYLVAIDDEQKILLDQAGIDFETLLSGVDVSQSHLVFTVEKPGESESIIPGAVKIGPGMWLSPTAVPADRKLRQKTVALDLVTTEFKYVPEVVYTFLETIGEYPTDTLADLISQDSVYSFVTRLEAFQTRYVLTDSIDAARDWLVGKFLDWGYTDVTTPEFDYENEPVYNVVAVKPGWAEPEKVIVVGAHYDSYNFDDPGPMVYAPGADDNASGTSTVLELARILADVPLRKTIIFIAFSAEEVGLFGSFGAAETFVQEGTDIEIMYNFDMVGYDPNDLRQVDLWSGPNPGYSQIMHGAAERVTTLDPRLVAEPRWGSDQYAFYTNGFEAALAVETDFNWDGWHTNLDISSRMNFEFLTEVVKMATAGLGVVANSISPTPIEDIIDMGDAQSLKVVWTDCDPSYDYTVYYGTSSGQYDYTVSVPVGQCFCVVDGLDEGVTYFFTVVGEVEGAYPLPYVEETSGTPYLIPRPPQNVTAEPQTYAVGLEWDNKAEADLSHYRIYRDDGTGLELHWDNVPGSSFSDSDVVSLIDYVYRVSAVDLDGYESDLSDEAIAYAYAFDLGVLLVDETTDDPYLPNQAEQEAFFDSIFSGIQYALDTVGGTTDTLPRKKAGCYSSLLWLDDDVSNKDIQNNESTIAWYTANPTNMFLGGWQTITRWVDSPISGGHVLYEEFGITSYDQNDVNDFVGAVGQGDWPSVTCDDNNLWNGKLPYIPALEERTGATVIYTYDSFSDNPAFEGEPCGLLYETDHGKRIVLAFPVWWLTLASSQAIIARVATEFGHGPSYMYGDADGSQQVDILDLDFLVDYLFRGGPAPVVTNAGDVDGSCQLDILDLDYLVDYLYKGGPSPNPGCVM